MLFLLIKDSDIGIIINNAFKTKQQQPTYTTKHTA